MRNYELMFVADPRLSDEEFVAMADDYKRMLTEGGAEIVAEESWGRRKLAYPIEKLTEGRYMVLFLTANGKNPIPEVEHRMRQNDKVLRYLSVRTEGVHRTPVAAPHEEGEGRRPRFDDDGPGGGRRGRYDDGDRERRRDDREDEE
jgi:small subunit ribosomal protein S6